jgi:hypothetical protein
MPFDNKSYQTTALNTSLRLVNKNNSRLSLPNDRHDSTAGIRFISTNSTNNTDVDVDHHVSNILHPLSHLPPPLVTRNILLLLQEPELTWTSGSN